MYTNIVDTHAHMDDACFAGRLDEVLAAERERGVAMIIQSGSELASSHRSIELAERYPMVFASVGIYPNETANLPHDYLTQLRELARHPRVVAVGEIGMDYGYEQHPPREVQETVFREQLALAKEMGLPVVIHDRDADEDVIRVLHDFPQVRGAVHRIFSETHYAMTLLEMGLYMGVGPQVTYPNSEKLVELVRRMPLERLLLETDAPFLPVYGESAPALPSCIAAVAEQVARIRGDVTPQEAIDAAGENAARLYGLPR